jgi:hypothetical protein
MELRIARVGKLGRLPTSDDRRAFGRDLARILADVASQ